ncbi:DinB family protein [Paenibacillus soyae]|uniref:DinB family protein n=1 Tax=Paenibacillus soyae TaxID=2969249 RepID=A0A9X2SA47_9BACL|nr:DinB family protein [Paenibacillus soyae]MCR2805851.1 DinB family protein [Paenibacillus soyae]
MNAIELAVLNFEEIRRRSILVWESIPAEGLEWKPDGEALSVKEMIRHVLDSEHYYHLALLQRGSLKTYESPFEERPFTTVREELAFAKPYREQFMNTVRSFTESELSTIQIDRSDVGYIRSLGDMLMRIAYHESIHTGQLLDYLRTAGIGRPKVWD